MANTFSPSTQEPETEQERVPGQPTKLHRNPVSGKKPQTHKEMGSMVVSEPSAVPGCSIRCHPQRGRVAGRLEGCGWPRLVPREAGDQTAASGRDVPRRAAGASADGLSRSLPPWPRLTAAPRGCAHGPRAQPLPLQRSRSLALVWEWSPAESGSAFPGLGLGWALGRPGACGAEGCVVTPSPPRGYGRRS